MKLLIAADVSTRLQQSVLPAIAKLTSDSTAEIVVLHVIHAASEAWSDEELRQVNDERRQTLETMLADSRVPWELLIESLPYGDELPSYIANRAEDVRADGVVVCSKRATGVFAGILGSVAQGLLRESTLPVIVVRPDHEEDAVAGG